MRMPEFSTTNYVLIAIVISEAINVAKQFILFNLLASDIV